MTNMKSADNDLELFSGSNRMQEEVFSSYSDYENFREDFFNSLKDDFEKLAQARRISEEEAMRRWYH